MVFTGDWDKSFSFGTCPTESRNDPVAQFCDLTTADVPQQGSRQ